MRLQQTSENCERLSNDTFVYLLIAASSMNSRIRRYLIGYGYNRVTGRVLVQPARFRHTISWRGLRDGLHIFANGPRVFAHALGRLNVDAERRAIDDHTIVADRRLEGHQSVHHIALHGQRIPFKRIATAACARGAPANQIAGVQPIASLRMQ